MKGFTLIELLIVLAILGVLAAVGFPLYTGYIDATNVTLVQNNLRSVYLQQQDYLVNNGIYYSTGVACGDHAALINANLFSNTQVLDNSAGFNYCILQTAPTNFQVRAEEIGGAARVYTLSEQNVDNF